MPHSCSAPAVISGLCQCSSTHCTGVGAELGQATVFLTHGAASASHLAVPAGRRSWACRRGKGAPPAACRRAQRGSGACWRPQGPYPVWRRCSFLQRVGLGSGWGLVCQDRLEMPLRFLRGHPASPPSELSQPLPAPPPLATRAHLSLPHLRPGPRPATPLSALPEGTALEASSKVKMAEVSGLTRAAVKVAGMAPCYPVTPNHIPSPWHSLKGLSLRARGTPLPVCQPVVANPAAAAAPQQPSSIL